MIKSLAGINTDSDGEGSPGVPWNRQNPVGIRVPVDKFAKRTHPSSVTRPLLNKNVNRGYLLEASLEGIWAHVWNNGGLRLIWSTTPIKVKTIFGATFLSLITDASGTVTAIRRRSFL